MVVTISQQVGSNFDKVRQIFVNNTGFIAWHQKLQKLTTINKTE